MIGLLVGIALIGLLVWALTTLIPMPEKIRQALIVVAVVGVVLMALSAFGLLPGWVRLKRD